MARRNRSAASAVLVLLLCAAAVSAAAAAAVAGKGKGRVGSARAGPPPCQDLATQGDCAARAGCRWCRSEALDDMCFGATEAWRLPRQVFSCDPPSGAGAGAAHAR
ncbi:hypothetical protein BDA96_03G306700 [Sorghum bicolor]|uniref:Bowman-Birk serine protease inhibitors family domain-containing protein n=2 Tax=Sorghum bicolor TaxID=4558 RepID=A0A921RFQ3_SORBI|nr:uncharacterized protein LOC8062120 [Sorghum bicolor]EES03556.1 hypothetical protein SORBI_3003G284100 [Sorghum bicolor]KAG0539252.1 hypothetical protein BDA96_03G306700 [Sorghum bicolor]|eukprot:XP_002458436.1 uncharacterized protein LOC8062120 [Sorghum bicolor]